MIRSPLFWRLALSGIGLLILGAVLGAGLVGGRGLLASGVLAAAGVLLVLFGAGRLSGRTRRLLAKASALGGPETGPEAPAPTPPGDEFALLEERLEAESGRLRREVEKLEADRNRLTAVFSGMVEGVVAIDSDRRVIHLNAVAAERFGSLGPASAVGRSIYELSRQPEIAGALIEAMEKRRQISRTYRSPSTFGEQRERRKFELNASPLLAVRAGGEQVDGAVLVIHDVSELERLEGMRRDFVSNVSHELKTPLTAIHGFVETLLEMERTGRRDRARRRRFLRKIRKQSKRLGALVSDLLTLSRIESATGNPGELVDLGAAVDDVLSLLVPTGEERGLDVRLARPEDPVTVRGEEEAIRQALSNLVDNAVKYSPCGGRVEVRLHAGNGRALLEVEDHGPGIASEHLDRIFERFYRVDRARSRELGGTGLGLSIVKNVVERHGGGVEVESEPGRGSTFRFWLPTSGPATDSGRAAG